MVYRVYRVTVLDMVHSVVYGTQCCIVYTGMYRLNSYVQGIQSVSMPNYLLATGYLHRKQSMLWLCLCEMFVKFIKTISNAARETV